MREAGAVIVGRYRLDRLVGRGGMGEVWEALDLQSRRAVALKFLAGGDAPSAELIARFQREIRITAGMGSRHIVGVHDAGQVDRDLFMVMDLLDGEDIAQLASRLGRLPVGLAARIVAQTCEGLAVAHASGVIHRDIKPGNLFLARTADADTRVVKILDFGIARIRPTDAGGEAATSITRTGTIVGSPAYMAPEQLRGARTVDERVDVWSAGVVMYRLLAGVVPHTGRDDSLPELMFAICGTPAPPLRERAPWVPTALAELVHHALAIDAADRLPSVRAFGDGLAAYGTSAITDAMLVPNREALVATIAAASDTEPARPAVPASASMPLVVKFVVAPPVKRRPFPTALVVVLVVVAGGALARRQLTRPPLAATLADIDPPTPAHAAHPRPIDVHLSTELAGTDGARWFADAQPHCTASEASGYLLDHPPKLTKDGTAFAAACLALAGDVDRAHVTVDSVAPADRGYAAWAVHEVGLAIVRTDVADARLGPIFRLVIEYWPRRPFPAYYAGIVEYVHHDARARDHLALFAHLYDKDDGFAALAARLTGDLSAPSAICARPLAVDPNGLRVFPASCR